MCQSPVSTDASVIDGNGPGATPPQLSGLREPKALVGSTGYTRVMAKVMVSLPDDLLGSLDAEAARRNTTRSGLLRDYVHEGLRRRGQARARRVQQLIGEAGHHGGNGVADLKRHRPTA